MSDLISKEALITALKEKQLRVFYQPKYDIRGDEPCLKGAEALVRWAYPAISEQLDNSTTKVMTPDMFLPLFEQEGLLHELDLYVWTEAARQISAWKKELGVTVPVSVNISRMDLYDSGLSETLLRIIRENGIRTNDFMLEIREADYVADADGVTRAVENLRDHGFRIVMDDFGRGYSSLNMLIALPIHVLKLDMKYLSSSNNSETIQQMVRFFTDVADYLHFDIVAEGVEKYEELQLLKNHGCCQVQGFYYSEPMRAEQFSALLTNG